MENKVVLKTDLATAKKIYEKATPELKEILIQSFGIECFSTNIMDVCKTFEQAYMLADKQTRDEFDNDVCKSKSGIAFNKLKLIYKVFNGEWVADFNNKNQQKHYPLHEKSVSGFVFSNTDFYFYYTFSFCGSRLCTFSSEMAEHIGKQFVDIFEDYLLN